MVSSSTLSGASAILFSASVFFFLCYCCCWKVPFSASASLGETLFFLFQGETLETVTTALVCLCSTQQSLLDHIPQLGYINKVFNAMSAHNNAIPKAAIQLAHQFSSNEVPTHRSLPVFSTLNTYGSDVLLFSVLDTYSHGLPVFSTLYTCGSGLVLFSTLILIAVACPWSAH